MLPFSYADGRSSDDVITSHAEGRAPLGHKGTMGMFLCPGYKRDFYVAAINGTIARILVDNSLPPPKL